MLLREKELAPILAEFKNLPETRRRPQLPDPAGATPPRRPVPKPPEGGLIIRGYCTYIKHTPGGPERAPKFYYKENPDAWAAETQSDMLWLTEAEWRSLIPEKPGPGEAFDVPAPIQRRFFSTLGIDYMEGSVNALPVRRSQLTLRPAGTDGGVEVLEVAGEAEMGKPQGADTDSAARTRGSELEVFGRITYDPATKKIRSFDLVGLGEAWGNKMNYTNRAIRIGTSRWPYGIACELVTGDAPYDRVPPSNLLHYGSGMKYFGSD